MKIKPEHYEQMKAAINSLDRQKVTEHKALGLGQNKEKRFVWDLFSAAKLYSFASVTLYSYLNDSHIETALFKIVKELEL
jgi:hypothetical protein